MTPFCNLLLLAVGALSAGVGTSWVGVSGVPADTRAAAGAVNFLLFGGRWVCLTTVLAVCGARGAFTSPGGWSRAGATLGWLFAYMLLELIGSFFTAAGYPMMTLPRCLPARPVLL